MDCSDGFVYLRLLKLTIPLLTPFFLFATIKLSVQELEIRGVGERRRPPR